METYFDSHLDLLQRRLSKQSDKLKMRAEETFNDVFKKDLFKIKAPSGDLEREMQKFKLKVRPERVLTRALLSHDAVSQISQRMTSLVASWQSAKIIRTREKITFMFGVMSLLFTVLIFGLYPEYAPDPCHYGTATDRLLFS